MGTGQGKAIAQAPWYYEYVASAGTLLLKNRGSTHTEDLDPDLLPPGTDFKHFATAKAAQGFHIQF